MPEESKSDFVSVFRAIEVCAKFVFWGFVNGVIIANVHSSSSHHIESFYISRHEIFVWWKTDKKYSMKCEKKFKFILMSILMAPTLSRSSGTFWFWILKLIHNSINRAWVLTLNVDLNCIRQSHPLALSQDANRPFADALCSIWSFFMNSVQWLYFFMRWKCWKLKQYF